MRWFPLLLVDLLHLSKTAVKKKKRSVIVNNESNIQNGNSSDNDKVTTTTQITNSFKALQEKISLQYQQRLSADPNFVSKSIAEVITAAGTQLTAEVGRRGLQRMGPEIDFVIAGLLTAVAGKYYSMWMVAPTSSVSNCDDVEHEMITVQTKSWKDNVPTNAFQSKLLNGQTPTMKQRLLSLFVPIPSLFKAGLIASTIGYGFTSILILLRSLLVPSYAPQTVNVNVLYASVFTGAFMATVSNIRYQLLQGVVEPKIIDRLFGGKWPQVKTLVIVLVRWANGLLGSTLAIMGMKYFGLQRLK
mmetsp:Transcript_22233/g.29607  ORF Transcript_22233/g.29607 Transcript_22233/m.29607 type:complete len:302 (-) Transcript_22233:53-958(-)